jgi:murein DD-endopeptidase MepM/ murein hydrolase activator NlpD
MNIFMGVHTNNDLTRAGVVLAGFGRLGHPGHGRLSPARLGNGLAIAGPAGDQDCDGALVSGKV